MRNDTLATILLATLAFSSIPRASSENNFKLQFIYVTHFYDMFAKVLIQDSLALR